MNSRLLTLVAAGFFALSSQTLASSNHLASGGMSGGGGDPVGIYFEEGRDLAAHILHEIEDRVLADGQDPNLKQWLKANKHRLAQDILASPITWSDTHDTCAWTLYSPKSEIQLSVKNCRDRVNSKEEAAKILIHEAAHHLSIEDHAKADRIAVETFAAWERMKLLAVPACPTEHNMVVSVIPGSWETDVDLRKRLHHVEESLDDLKIEFVRDDLVANKFPPVGACALMAGHITFHNLRDKPLTTMAILVPAKGNVHLIWLEKWYEDGSPDFESSILNVARAQDPANDLLFLGEDFNEGGVIPLRRVRK